MVQFQSKCYSRPIAENVFSGSLPKHIYLLSTTTTTTTTTNIIVTIIIKIIINNNSTNTTNNNNNNKIATTKISEDVYEPATMMLACEGITRFCLDTMDDEDDNYEDGIHYYCVMLFNI